jgi:hypothetical protein
MPAAVAGGGDGLPPAEADAAGVPIVWGGYFPSQHADACLSESTVDVCVTARASRRCSN